MTWDDNDSEWVSALRGDLPSAPEQERVRRRLTAAGLAVGAELATSSAAATAASQSGWAASAWAKLGAMPWAGKLGLSFVVATAALSAPSWVVSTANSVPQPAERLAPRASVSAAEPVRTAPAPAAAPVVTEPSPTAATPVEATPIAVGPRASSAVASPQPLKAELDRSAPAVAAFPAQSSGKPGSAPAASTLAEETRLLDRAFTALAAGDNSNAAALIAEHERRFPNGLLRQERERARDRLNTGIKGE